MAGDEVYGDNGPLRGWLEEQDIAHVLAVACRHRVPAGAGLALRAGELAARLPKRAWQQLPVGEGAKGKRYDDWAWIRIGDRRPGHRHLLIRRNRSTGELAFYRCYSPHPVTHGTLDEHQVRRWTSWYRWVTLAMLAAAVLTIAAAAERTRRVAPEDQIPLTRNKIAHLLATLITGPAHSPGHRLHWSPWRRRHQHRARTCHYQRQTAQEQPT